MASNAIASNKGPHGLHELLCKHGIGGGRFGWAYRGNGHNSGCQLQCNGESATWHEAQSARTTC